MTPTEEARFIQLWTAGASYADIAQAMQLKLGTVASRAATLVRQGKIQPRPRGGAYPSQRAKARSDTEGEPSTVHRPRSTVDRPPSTVDPVPSTVDHFRVDLQAALTAAL